MTVGYINSNARFQWNCDFVIVSAGTSQLKISSTQKKCYQQNHLNKLFLVI